MNIFRNILISLASLLFISAVTGFAYVFTVHTTIMDRQVVKTWLSESKVYDGRLINALVQTATTSNPQKTNTPSPSSSLNPSPEVVRTALNATFTPDFTQSQIEGVVNNAYDWIDGFSPEFKFSIPIDQKRDVLIAELAKGIEPQIAALPICQARSTAQTSVCRPPNVTVEQLASEITTQSINESGAFAKPISSESLTQTNAQQPQKPSLSQLPAVHNTINILLWALPAVCALSLVIIIVATSRGKRLARVSRLSRRTSFSMLFIFIPTAVVVWLAKDNDFGLSGIFNQQIGELAVPLIKTILIGVLSQLGLMTGIIATLSIVAWIILTILIRNKPQPSSLAPLVTQPEHIIVSTPQPPQQSPLQAEANSDGHAITTAPPQQQNQSNSPQQQTPTTNQS